MQRWSEKQQGDLKQPFHAYLGTLFAGNTTDRIYAFKE